MLGIMMELLPCLIFLCAVLCVVIIIIATTLSVIQLYKDMKK